MSEYGKSEIKPDTYIGECELRVLVCRDCYIGITILANNYQLVDNCDL